eukprot:14646569-Alexandrium_andersonii.AAC.1
MAGTPTTWTAIDPPRLLPKPRRTHQRFNVCRPNNYGVRNADCGFRWDGSTAAVRLSTDVGMLIADFAGMDQRLPSDQVRMSEC